MKISVIFTCYNRKEKTINCIDSLLKGNPEHEMSFIVVDDNSIDGTREVLSSLNYRIQISRGDGNLFWSGGMRKGISIYLENPDSDYVLLVNDDVVFFPEIISNMIMRSEKNDNALVAGATCDDKGDFSYGAMKLNVPRKREWYYYVKPTEENLDCDMFNCNCVLIKDEVIRTVGNFDSVYHHSLADFDYGFKVKKRGYKIISSAGYIGVCNRNSIKGTWRDTSLSRIQRMKIKETVKGAPAKEWFYFMNKNLGLIAAIRYSVSPYVRIMLNK